MTQPWRWVSYRDALWAWPCSTAHLSEWFERLDLDEDLGPLFADEAYELYAMLLKVEVRAAIRAAGDQLPELELLWIASLIRRATDDVLAELVAESRSEGVSWTQIGRALGVGRTAAQKRFGHWPSEEQERLLDHEADQLIDHCQDVLVDDEADEETLREARRTLEQLLQRLEDADPPDRR